jgi:hypothetical protein
MSLTGQSFGASTRENSPSKTTNTDDDVIIQFDKKFETAVNLLNNTVWNAQLALSEYYETQRGELQKIKRSLRSALNTVEVLLKENLPDEQRATLNHYRDTILGLQTWADSGRRP